MSELDANIIVDGQKVIAVQAQEGTVVKDGGAVDATSIIQTDSGLQKVVKVMDISGGGGGGGGGSRDYVVETQLPTSQNSYQWYRKYKSGWVEQGGRHTITTSADFGETITLPVEMADTNYNALCVPVSNHNNWPLAWCPLAHRTTTTINVDGTGNYTESYKPITIEWEVKGQSNTNE